MDELVAFDTWLASKRTLTEPERLLAKAAWNDAWAAATNHERERCAKLCDTVYEEALNAERFSFNDVAIGESAAAEACANSIRAA